MDIVASPSARPEVDVRSNGLATKRGGRRWSLLLLGAVVLATAVIVDPFREFLSEDDGWAYARSVEALLRTGSYRLDAWSAANNPVQIYLAAGLSHLFGYSLSLLRISTLLLLVAGLGAFHALLRELGVAERQSATLTLALFASPLVLMLSFTFMSDVQFMSWMVLASWLYVRGLKRRSVASLVAGAVAAACAIGTRQFGIALLAGLLIAWTLPRAGRRPPALYLVYAAALPLLAAAWQVWAGLGQPNFTQAVRLHEQAYYLSLPPLAMLRELTWRLSTIVQYLGLSMLPVLPLLIASLLDRESDAGTRRVTAKPSRAELLATLAFAVLMAFSLVPSPLTTRDNAGHALPLWWMLPNAFWDHPFVTRGLALAGVAGAFILIVLAARRLAEGPALRDIEPARLVPACTGICLLMLHLSYVQLNDTYLVGLLPFALLIPAQQLRAATRASSALTASVILSIVMALLLAAWMRGDYNRQEAQWAAADRLVAIGEDPRCIGASRHWSEYHGAFDDWLAETYPRFDHTFGARSPAAPGSLHDPFYAWHELRSWQANFQVRPAWQLIAPPGWRIVSESPFRNAYFARRSIMTLQRTTPRPPGSVTCRSIR